MNEQEPLDFTADDFLAVAQASGATPTQTAVALQRWRGDVLAATKARAKDPADWLGRVKRFDAEHFTPALAQVRIAESETATPEEMADNPALWTPGVSRLKAPLMAGGRQVGAFDLVTTSPEGAATAVVYSYAEDKDGRKARLALDLPAPTGEAITARRTELEAQAREARAEAAKWQDLNNPLMAQKPEGGGGFWDQVLGGIAAAGGPGQSGAMGAGATERTRAELVEDARRRERDALARRDVIDANPQLGFLTDALERKITSPEHRDKFGSDLKLGADFMQGLTGFYVGNRITWNDLTQDTAERDEWMKAQADLAQTMPGTNTALTGTGGRIASGLASTAGQQAPLMLAAGVGNAGRVAGLASMGTSSYGQSRADTSAQVTWLRAQAAALRAHGHDDAATEAEQTAYHMEASAVTRAMATGATEIGTEMIFPEEKLLAKTGRGFLARTAVAGVQNATEEAAAQVIEGNVIDPLTGHEAGTAGDVVQAAGMGALFGAGTTAAMGPVNALVNRGRATPPADTRVPNLNLQGGAGSGRLVGSSAGAGSTPAQNVPAAGGAGSEIPGAGVDGPVHAPQPPASLLTPPTADNPAGAVAEPAGDHALQAERVTAGLKPIHILKDWMKTDDVPAEYRPQDGDGTALVETTEGVVRFQTAMFSPDAVRSFAESGQLGEIAGYGVASADPKAGNIVFLESADGRRAAEVAATDDQVPQVAAALAEQAADGDVVSIETPGETLQRRVERRAEEARAKAAAAPLALEPEVDLFGNPIAPEPGESGDSALADFGVQEVPLAELRLSEDVPQFKGGANKATGVVDPLAGKFERLGTGPILVWQRLDGRKEVISGRHRFDLANRSGEATIPAQVVHEAAGFTKRDAMMADAELNIRDEKGDIKDFANYFRHAGLDRAGAESRGLLARTPGRLGWAIGRDGGESIFALHQNGKLSDAAAAQLAQAAPGDDALQRVGAQSVLEGGAIDVSVNLMRAVGAAQKQAGAAGKQLDLFGADDSAMVAMKQQAKRAAAIQRGISEKISAVQGAVKRPEVARKLGVDVADPEGVAKKITELKGELERWNNWPMHPDLVAQTRDTGARHSLAGSKAKTSGAMQAGRVNAQNPVLDQIAGVGKKDIFDGAKKRHGLTRSIYEAGYVLPDGSMLDFSGRADAGYMEAPGFSWKPKSGIDYLKDQRSVDHREIEWAGMPEYKEVWEAMNDFLRLGAVRIDANSGMISMHSRAKLTSAQTGVLKALVTGADGAYLDLEDDDGKRSSMQLDGGKWGRVNGFLTRWANGETPEFSGVSFSISPDSLPPFTPTEYVPETQARKWLSQRFGKSFTGRISFVPEERAHLAVNEDGLVWSGQVKGGKITLNPRYIHSVDHLADVMHEELAHLVEADPAVAAAWQALERGLSAADRTRLEDLVSAYPEAQRASELNAHFAAEMARLAPTGWKKLLAKIKVFLRKLFGRDATELEAQLAAQQIVLAGAQRVMQAGATGKQLDLFGADDSAMLAMKAQAKRAAAIQRGISEKISAVQGAVKRPEVARKLGVDVADPEGVAKKITELKGELERWANWPMHPDLVAQTRDSGARHSLAPVTQAMDAEYMAAVKAGDMKAAQRMVDEAAKRAGYDSPKVFRNETTKGIVVYNPKLKKRIGSERGVVFWTTNINTAKSYSGNEIKSAYLKYSNPLTHNAYFSVKESSWKELIKQAQEDKNDSVIVENVIDVPGRFHGTLYDNDLVSDVIGVFNANQIKSADPITRDDAGNIIPLSQRFNAASDDIRNSLSPDSLPPFTPTEFVPETQARKWLSQRFGKSFTGRISFVPESKAHLAVNEDGLVWSGQVKGGKITLNPRYIHSIDHLADVIHEELAHLVERDPAVAAAWQALERGLSAADRARLTDLVAAYPQDQRASELNAHWAAEMARMAPTGWRKFLAQIKIFLRKLWGRDATQLEAQLAAQQIVQRGAARMRETGGTGAGFNLTNRPDEGTLRHDPAHESSPAAVLAALTGGRGSHGARAGADTTGRRKSGDKLASVAAFVEWASARGRVAPPEAITEAFARNPLPLGGGEHVVIPGTDRVLKLTKPGTFGYNAGDAGEYVRRWALHNRAFNDDVQILGITTLEGESEPRHMISQPWYEGRTATPAEVRKHLKEHGWHELEAGRWVHPARGITAWDVLGEGNAIMTAEGVQVIDALLAPSTRAELDTIAQRTGFGRPTAFSIAPGQTNATPEDPRHTSIFGQRVQADERLSDTTRDMPAGTFRVKGQDAAHKKAAEIIRAKGRDGAYGIFQQEGATSGLELHERLALGFQLMLQLDALASMAAQRGDAGRTQELDAAVDQIAKIKGELEYLGNETGRALGMFNSYMRLSPDGQVRRFERQVAKDREEQVTKVLGVSSETATAAAAQSVAEAQAEVVDELVAQILGLPTPTPAKAGTQKVPERNSIIPKILAKVEAISTRIAHAAPLKSLVQSIDSILNKLKSKLFSDPLLILPITQLALKATRGFLLNGMKLADAVARAVAQARATMPDPTVTDAEVSARIARAIGQEILRKEIAKLATATTPDGQAAVKALMDSGMSNVEAVRTVTAVMHNLPAIRGTMQARAQNKLISKLAPKAKATAKAKIPPFVKALVEAHDNGAVNVPRFQELFADKFGLPVMDAAFRDRLKALARAVVAAPEGSFLRQDASRALNAEIARWKGLKSVDVAVALWYANVLSGIGTQTVNLTQNAIHLAMRTLSTAMVTNPRDTYQFLRGMLGEGARMGRLSARAALRGEAAWGSEKFKGAGMLELLYTDSPRGFWKRVGNFAALGRFVFRALSAGDALFFHTAQQGAVYLAASRLARDGVQAGAGNYADLLSQELHGSATTARDALAQAKLELAAVPGRKVTPQDVARRTWEIIEQQRRPELRDAGKRFAERMTFNNKPDGLLGAVADGINAFNRGAGPVFQILGVPFVNIVANVMSHGLDFTPVGALRAIKGTHLRNNQGTEFSTQERLERFAASVLGTVAAGLIGSLVWAHRDDEDPAVMITAMGKKDTPSNLRYTIKIGDKYFKYNETPMAIPFSILGGMMDNYRYQNGTDASWDERAWLAVGLFPRAFMDSGFLQGVNNILDVAHGDRHWNQSLIPAAKGFIPAQGLLRDISRITDPTVTDPKSIRAAILKDLPWIEGWGTKPMLNVWGEPVVIDTLQKIPAVSRLMSNASTDPDTEWLARHRLSLPPLSESFTITAATGAQKREMQDLLANRIETLGRKAAGVLTQDEAYELTKIRGPILRERIQKLRAAVEATPALAGDRVGLQSLVSKENETATKLAKEQLFNLRAPSKPAPPVSQLIQREQAKARMKALQQSAGIRQK